ncbi:molybdopterin-guanine dinucleotide biosynthesis protein B [Metaplanococcus flavidus]
METIKILQIVGFKNSGKTTLLTRFMETALKSNKQVSTIKHHGHGGDLDMPEHGTDSMRFFEKGAASSLAYGNGVVQLHLQTKQAELQKFIRLSQLAEPDLILIEGFKKADFPKVVLVRNVDDWQELQKLSKIELVIVHKGVMLEKIKSVELDNEKEIDNFFIQWMEGENR